MEKTIYYLVVITDYDYYQESHLFLEKFEAEKFMKHNILPFKSWAQYIEEKILED